MSSHETENNGWSNTFTVIARRGGGEKKHTPCMNTVNDIHWEKHVNSILSFLAGPVIRNYTSTFKRCYVLAFCMEGSSFPPAAIQYDTKGEQNVDALSALIGNSERCKALLQRASGRELAPLKLPCPICLDEDMKILLVARCGHPVCLPCVLRCVDRNWSVPTLRCPVCRANIVIDIPSECMLLGPCGPRSPLEHKKNEMLVQHILLNTTPCGMVVIVSQRRHLIPFLAKILIDCKQLGSVSHSKQP